MIPPRQVEGGRGRGEREGRAVGGAERGTGDPDGLPVPNVLLPQDRLATLPAPL